MPILARLGLLLCGLTLLSFTQGAGFFFLHLPPISRKRRESPDASLHSSSVRSLGYRNIALAGMYLNGQGVPQDFAVALAWYRKAADQADAGWMEAAVAMEAQRQLGLMYSNGEGTPQDYAQAVAWYRKAAEQGDYIAQNNVGVMYYYGNGVPQTFVVALTTGLGSTVVIQAIRVRLTRLLDRRRVKENVLADPLARRNPLSSPIAGSPL